MLPAPPRPDVMYVERFEGFAEGWGSVTWNAMIVNLILICYEKVVEDEFETT